MLLQDLWTYRYFSITVKAVLVGKAGPRIEREKEILKGNDGLFESFSSTRRDRELPLFQLNDDDCCLL
ncbi:uncharacterized protein ARMOST_17465 [Armillaria ostoyae]|uniref:Uncharacterized protein n=1 Tax=Armillaria ostoyae TaxID=47428 RepID=A0A284RZ20_ARMOS|nr:uncharacterized protein ARMOST_17465 [Armillaria ostoyae]